MDLDSDDFVASADSFMILVFIIVNVMPIIGIIILLYYSIVNLCVCILWLSLSFVLYLDGGRAEVTY